MPGGRQSLPDSFLRLVLLISFLDRGAHLSSRHNHRVARESQGKHSRFSALEKSLKSHKERFPNLLGATLVAHLMVWTP